MHLRPNLLPLLSLLILLLIPCAASADPLVITQGFITIGGVFPPGRGTFRSITYNFAGGNFSVQGGEADGGRQQVLSPCTFGPCLPNTFIHAGSNPSLQGLATVFVNNNNFAPAMLIGSMLTISGPQIALPDSVLDTIVLQTPFTLSGTLVVDGLVNGQFTPVFSSLISGQGIATLTLSRFTLNDVTGYTLHTIRYDFTNPVPEPTTILLLGTSLAGLTAAARRRRVRARQ